MVHHQLPVGPWGESYRWRRRGEPTKLLGMLNLPWQGFEKNWKKLKNAGMTERLVRDLAIEEDPQIEIQFTISKNN